MTEKYYTLNTKVDYKTYSKFKEYCKKQGTTPSAFIRKMILNVLNGKKNCTMEEVYKDIGDVANIFFDENNIYILGNLDINEPVIQEAINRYIDEKKYRIFNILYSNDINVMNIQKAKKKS
ncbi:hypothetical protein [Caldanaerobacter subterraneus]|uniref:Uncharacterized protein n=1 Tax=Caldanaerobacter subterraneus TaxID=911092 RepID=A0A7Y2PMB4_9THEO|nr:hypothetical protein [Caldanaerobacter subterraneus]NNG67540.1 hypothetical protein [Caldanaerobacter subterraneus]